MFDLQDGPGRGKLNKNSGEYSAVMESDHEHYSQNEGIELDTFDVRPPRSTPLPSVVSLTRSSPSPWKERLVSMTVGALVMMFFILAYQNSHIIRSYGLWSNGEAVSSRHSPVQDTSMLSMADEIKRLREVTEALQKQQVELLNGSLATNTKQNPPVTSAPEVTPVPVPTSTPLPNSSSTTSPTTSTVSSSLSSPISSSSSPSTSTSTSVSTATPTTPATTTTANTTPITPTPTTPTAPTTTTPTSTADTTTISNTSVYPLSPTSLPLTGLPNTADELLICPVPTAFSGSNGNNPQSSNIGLSGDALSSQRAKVTEKAKLYRQSLLQKQEEERKVKPLLLQDKFHPNSPFRKSDFSESQIPGNPPPIPTLIPAPFPFPHAPIPEDGTVAQRQNFIRNMISHAWNGYSKYCFGKDELLPATNSCHDWLGMGTTVVDSLSTLWLAGLKDEYAKAAEWVHTSLNIHNFRGDISFFETTIRIIGGLVSAYDLTGDARFIHKAVYVANSLHLAYTPHGLPHSQVNVNSRRTSGFGWAGNNHILAEIGTVQVEYMSLSHIFRELYREKTGISGNHSSPSHFIPISDKNAASPAYDDIISASLLYTMPVNVNEADIYASPLHHSGYTHYGALAHGVFEILNNMTKPQGLYPYYVTSSTPYRFANNAVTMGGLGDSFYEYLLKLWIMTGRKHEMYRKMYVEAMSAVAKYQYGEAGGSGFIGSWDRTLRQGMDHLSCFSGGMLALGVYTGAVTDPIDAGRHMRMAMQVTRTCAYSYISTATGIGPDNMSITSSGEIGVMSPAYHLRPETVESLFILWRVTKDPIYREWGWLIAQSLEESCKKSAGYTSLSDVRRKNSLGNKQETFLLAETLKYLFLLFSDDNALDLTQWVFNTEAHPIRVRNLEIPDSEAVDSGRKWISERLKALQNIQRRGAVNVGPNAYTPPAPITSVPRSTTPVTAKPTIIVPTAHTPAIPTTPAPTPTAAPTPTSTINTATSPGVPAATAPSPATPVVPPAPSTPAPAAPPSAAAATPVSIPATPTPPSAPAAVAAPAVTAAAPVPTVTSPVATPTPAQPLSLIQQMRLKQAQKLGPSALAQAQGTAAAGRGLAPGMSDTRRGVVSGLKR